MQCENNSKCKKKIINSYSCNKCKCQFCSNSCMIDHYFEKHQNVENNKTSNNHKGLSSGLGNTLVTKFEILKNGGLKYNNSSKPNTLPVNNNFPEQFLNLIFPLENNFMRAGDYLTEIKFDPYFEFKNFDKVKLGKKTHVLGAGAFGDVFLVKSKKDGKFFAVKQMEKQRILDTGAKLDIVRREIDIHMRLVHPYIVRLHSYYEDETSFFLLMDYANSGTLFSAIRKSKGMDEKRAFKYFIQTAVAVHFVHENNLIHRDIKPENLLLDDKDDIKLCDFGWCIELEIGNRTTFCGTIEYMAPEIIREMPYDRSIDVWSLGILLYELLHGYSPFRANSSEEEEEYSQVFKNIVKYNFKIDRSEISENCKDLITKLLTPQNNMRFKTKDIFSHPWVLEFQNIYESELKSKQEKIENCNKIENSKNKLKEPFRKISIGMGIPKSVIKIEDGEVKNFQDLEVNRSEIKKKSAKDSKLEEHREKIKENLLIQKLNSVKEAINSTQDFSHAVNGQKTDSLFDKVLSQVKDRNKEKQKKNKIIDSQFESDVDKFVDKDNQIVIQIETHQRKKSVDITRSIKNANPRTTNKDFQLLKDINQIEVNLKNNFINEENKKSDFLKNRENLKTEFDLNRSEIKKNTTKSKRNSKTSNLYIEDVTKIKGSYANIAKKNSTHNYNTSNLLSTNNKNKIPGDEEESKLIIKTETKSNLSNNNTHAITFTEVKPNIKMKGSPMSAKINDFLYSSSSKKGRESIQLPKSSIKSKTNNTYAKKYSLSGYLPRGSLYNYPIQSRNTNILSAIELLQKVQENKKEIDVEGRNKGFWEKVANFMNPFKCGEVTK